MKRHFTSNLNQNQFSLFKISSDQNKILKKSISLSDFHKKRLLFLFPFPNKVRINSEVYDNIIKSISLFPQLSQMDSKLKEDYNESLSSEIEKVKYLQSFDEIIGVSKYNHKEIIEFLHENHMINLSFIPDDNDSISKFLLSKAGSKGRTVFNSIINTNTLNEELYKYEIILTNEEIESCNIDPTLPDLLKLCSQFILGTILFGGSIGYILFNYFTEIKSKTNKRKDLLMYITS